MCLRSTSSLVSLPSSGNTNFWTNQRRLLMVRGLPRTSTCSTKYRYARSATVGVGGSGDGLQITSATLAKVLDEVYEGLQ